MKPQMQKYEEAALIILCAATEAGRDRIMLSHVRDIAQNSITQVESAIVSSSSHGKLNRWIGHVLKNAGEKYAGQEPTPYDVGAPTDLTQETLALYWRIWDIICSECAVAYDPHATAAVQLRPLEFMSERWRQAADDWPYLYHQVSEYFSRLAANG